MSAAYQLNEQRFETMLRLQLCAIYSQLHKHKAALEQAELSSQTAHSVVVGKHGLLNFLIQKEQHP